jgi:hypothetical protein
MSMIKRLIFKNNYLQLKVWPQYKIIPNKSLKEKSDNYNRKYKDWQMKKIITQQDMFQQLAINISNNNTNDKRNH